ncbi:hypothetical protein PI124_g1270 [Phytophthora idaei]|nr:hypothetical protein PI125_g5611 [Phytophthora idaei]KAG3173561.1 hypothetical protein PI126_g787 [Phytophthora idaei]KAG3254158.1 hypothetical protein PI124_g1270 [Phytophthora idaei]
MGDSEVYPDTLCSKLTSWFPPHITLGIDYANTRQDELREYVEKWLEECAGVFHARFTVLTGGHVGLCMTAIDALSDAIRLCEYIVETTRPAFEWINQFDVVTMVLQVGRPGSLYGMRAMCDEAGASKVVLARAEDFGNSPGRRPRATGEDQIVGRNEL